MTPDDLRYTDDHEWARATADGVVRVGITDHAQRQLGDVVLVELPAVGDAVSVGDACGTVESTKSVSEIYPPVAGEVVAVNEALADEPELVNQEPYGGGWMFERGTLDFAGGVPVEMASGFSALAAALVVGARKDYGRQALLPHNAVYVLVGAGLLWFGWFGFNGGSGIGANAAGALAFVNTLLTPACALITWFALDAITGRKVTAIGAATAIIVGCVLITPAGAYISPGWAMALGALGAIPCWLLVAYRPRTRVDETLDVLAAHGLAGLTGILFIGLVAQVGWNGLSDGLFYGNGEQFVDQLLAALATPVYAFVATFILLKLVGALMPLRASEREEAMGMDVIYHGEEAYPTGEGAILVEPDIDHEHELVKSG